MKLRYSVFLLFSLRKGKISESDKRTQTFGAVSAVIGSNHDCPFFVLLGNRIGRKGCACGIGFSRGTKRFKKSAYRF